MIDLKNSREARIKRANTDWWINEKAVVGANGMTYIAYVTDMGEIHVKEIDAKCSRTPSRDVTVNRFNCDYSDEHNAPSIVVLESGRIIVAYTGHATGGRIRYRMTERPYDIYSFGPERDIVYDGSVTYAQLFENSERGEVWIFSRVNSVNWEFRYSKDGGESFSSGNTFLHSDAGGLFYLNIRKHIVRSKGGSAERWFFALYGHPRLSADHCIRSGYFTSDGALKNPDGEDLGVNLFGGGQIELDRLSTVYDSPEGATVRLLEVSPIPPMRVGLCSFKLGEPESAVYYAATYRKREGWILSEPITGAGAFLSDKQTDGSETYIPGMAYYYGVGEEGIHPMHGGSINTNRLFIAHRTSEAWVIESFVSLDAGNRYTSEQVIKSIPLSEGKKIWRPTVPIYAQDNLQVYWHEGVYSAHTGGWHCDAVMRIEYDD